MSELKKHNFLLEVPKQLMKDYKKMVKEKGFLLGVFTINLMDNTVKQWKEKKEEDKS